MANESTAISQSSRWTPLTLGLSFVAGLGVILMIVALGIGVVQGATVDTGSLNLLFLAGVAALIAGVGGWVGVVQPYNHFDDINVPMYTGHSHEAPHEETAVVLHEDDGEVNVTEPVTGGHGH